MLLLGVSSEDWREPECLEEEAGLRKIRIKKKKKDLFLFL